MTRDYVTKQVMEVRDPLNRLTKYTYDTNGNVTSVIDPQVNPTLVEYEPTFNRVTKITDALNQITRFTYDPANGNLPTITDPRTHTTTVVSRPRVRDGGDTANGKSFLMSGRAE
jgi:YD repeat-containing protein